MESVENGAPEWVAPTNFAHSHLPNADRGLLSKTHLGKRRNSASGVSWVTRSSTRSANRSGDSGPFIFGNGPDLHPCFDATIAIFLPAGSPKC